MISTRHCRPTGRSIDQSIRIDMHVEIVPSLFNRLRVSVTPSVRRGLPSLPSMTFSRTVKLGTSMKC